MPKEKKICDAMRCFKIYTTRWSQNIHKTSSNDLKIVLYFHEFNRRKVEVITGDELVGDPINLSLTR